MSINLDSTTLIESILKRKGGSIVKFGYHGGKAVVYKFQPIDSTDPDSPHVADVTVDEHYNRFIAIQEGYRAFNSDDDYEPILNIPNADPSAEGFTSKNDVNDLLSVEPHTVSNEWLKEFAKSILKIEQKQALADMATSRYQLDFDYQTTTTNEIIRLILIERIAEERKAQINH